VAGEKLGLARDDTMMTEDDGRHDADDDADIAPPYALEKRRHPRGVAGLVSRVRLLSTSVLTSSVYPVLLYGACLLDAALLWFDQMLSAELMLLLQITIDLIFWGEFLLKVVSFGLFGNESMTIPVYEQGMRLLRVCDTYLAQRWNRLDLLCLLSTFSTLFKVSSLNAGSSQETLVFGFGLLRVLRPLRLVTRSHDMREIVLSLLQATGAVVRVIFFIAAIYLVFAVIGQGVFGYRLHRCTDVAPMAWQPSDMSNCAGSFQRDGDGLLAPRAWWTPGHFDSTVSSFTTLFKVGSLKWLAVLSDSMEITAVWAQPCSSEAEAAGRCSRDYLHTAALYFIIFVVIGSYFCVNLLVAVIIDAFFSTQNHDASDNNFIEWHAMKRLILKVITLNPKPKPKPCTPNPEPQNSKTLTLKLSRYAREGPCRNHPTTRWRRVCGGCSRARRSTPSTSFSSAATLCSSCATTSTRPPAFSSPTMAGMTSAIYTYIVYYGWYY